MDENTIDKCISEIELLRPLLSVSKYNGGYDCCGCSTLDDLYFDIIQKLKEL
jgi:hypothetical protein